MIGSGDADESQVFFAVHGNKVVLESCNFGSDEPLVLKRKQDDDPIWHSHPYFDAALESYWYRKFYAETLTGQLMVMRPDEPTLYHYERPRARDGAKDIELVTLIKAYRLLWVVVSLLAAIAFPVIQVPIGILAVVLVIDVLVRWWATRNLGE